MGANRKLSGAMKLWAVAALFAVMHTATAATVGPVTDDLGVVRIAKGAPIQIGGYWVMSGADTALGLDGKRGAEIAFDDIGNKLLGHPIKFTVEDDRCNAEGGQTAATKLASNPQTVVVLGRSLLQSPPLPPHRSFGSRALPISATRVRRPRSPRPTASLHMTASPARLRAISTRAHRTPSTSSR